MVKIMEVIIQNQLDTIGKIVLNKEKSHEKDKDHVPSGYLLERLVFWGMFYAEKSGGK